MGWSERTNAQMKGVTADPSVFTALKNALDFSAGSMVAEGLKVTEHGVAGINRTVIELDNFRIALGEGGSDPAAGGGLIYNFPEGVIDIQNALADLTMVVDGDGVDADWEGDFSLGTVETDGTDLTGTEQDIIPKTSTPEGVAGASTAQGHSTATQDVVFDGSATAKELWLNFLVDAADNTVNVDETDFLVSGRIVVTWVDMGNFS